MVLTRIFFRKRTYATVLIILVVLTSYFDHRSKYRKFIGNVVSVADGDTITVERADGKRSRVRLYGIDAPELHQEGGREAREFADKLLYQKKIAVIPVDIDKYKRIVAVIKMDEGMANELIVAEGYAWWYHFHAPEYRQLKQLEQNAREKKIGIWTNSSPMPPWEWRKKQHGNSDER